MSAVDRHKRSGFTAVDEQNEVVAHIVALVQSAEGEIEGTKMGHTGNVLGAEFKGPGR